MKLSAGAGTAVAAVAIVVGTTFIHGRMTERWTDRNVTGELSRAAALLEGGFPREAGDWRAVEDLKADPQELQRAGAVGYVSRTFRRDEGGPPVAAFVVCATPHKASGHTPDRCYPGAGFEIGETEHRETIVLADGRRAEAFSGTFRKSGQTLRVFWTYGVDGRWIAPQIARIELAGTSAVYKLYAIIDETRLPGGEATVICADFLSALLPEFDAAMFDTKPAEGEAPPAARPQGAAADPAGTALIAPENVGSTPVLDRG